MVRDRNLIKSMKTTDKGLVATKTTIIEVPELYVDHDLLVLGDNITVLGCFALIIGNAYAVASIATMLAVTPDNVSLVVKSDKKYYNLTFDVGTLVIPHMAIQRPGVAYKLINLYIFHANHPWYIGVDELYAVLNSTSYYGDIDTDGSPEVLELLITLAARIEGKLDTLYKNGKGKLKWVSLSDVTYLNAVFSKITNNYQAVGMVSSLISTPTPPSEIEKIVRR